MANLADPALSSNVQSLDRMTGNFNTKNNSNKNAEYNR